MTARPTEADVERWLIDRISALTGHPASAIDPDRAMESYGLTSVMAVGMSADLEDWLGIRVEATIVWDYPTVAALAGYLAAVIAGARPQA